MTTLRLPVKGADLFVRDEGSGPTLVMAHSLAMDHTIWDGVASHFPDHRIVRYDLRGHGQSDAPDGPYSMGQLVSDAETLCDSLKLRDVTFVGLSIGGMIAQGLAVKRLDIVRAVVMACSGAKLGQPGPWHDRAKTARTEGMSALADSTFARWHIKPQPIDRAKDIFLNTNPEGYAATCEAIAGTDFYTPTSGLRLPTLAIAGGLDGATPPDLLRETADLIPGSEFALIPKAGHLAPETHPTEFAKTMQAFLSKIGHA